MEIGELVDSVTDSSTVGDNDRALGDPWPPDIEMSYALAHRSGPPMVLSDDLLSSGSESLVSLPSPVPKSVKRRFSASDFNDFNQSR